MEESSRYPIRYVVRQTGLSPHVIRAWERRYQAVTPHRTAKNRRLYSDADIERLRVLKLATERGHSISQIASLPRPALMDLVAADTLEEQPLSAIDQQAPSRYASPSAFYEACLAAVIGLDKQGLEECLTRASVALTREVLLERVIVPLLRRIGDLWRKGSLKIINEHMASMVVRAFLWDMLRASPVSPNVPRIVMATPVGDWHELGALLAAVAAVESGWKALYFGPNLPAEEIAAAAEQSQARAVGLSIMHRLQEDILMHEARKLRQCLSDRVAIIVGGLGVTGMEEFFQIIGAILCADIRVFRSRLEALLSSESDLENTDTSAN